MARAKRPDVDWDAVERAYRLGAQSNRVIAKEFDVTESAIRSRAAANGWIKGEATAVRELAVRKANEKTVPRYLPADPERLEALAEVGSEVLVRHRTNIATMAGLVQLLTAQLHAQTIDERDLAESLTEYFELKAASNPLLAAQYKQQLNTALHAIGLGNRTKSMTNLANAAGRLIELERKAWNLDADNDTRSYEDLLAEVLGKQQANAA